MSAFLDFFGKKILAVNRVRSNNILKQWMGMSLTNEESRPVHLIHLVRDIGNKAR